MDTFDLFLSDIIEEGKIDENKMLKQEKQQIKNEYHKKKVVQKQKEKKKKFKEHKYQLIQEMQTQDEKNNFVHSFKARREEKRENGLKSLQSPYRIVIDCGFELNMSEKEQRSLARQMSELYMENRKLQQPLKIHITNVYPLLDGFLTQYNYKKWSIISDERLFLDMEEFNGTNIVYLSPDAEEELKEVREDEVYVIGGLVDRVIMKNATLNRSKLLGVRCARLPIGQFIKKSYKKCLNVSTAVLMLAAWLELKDWEKAFDTVVPPKFKAQEL